MSTFDYDLIIVGSGPAGVSTWLHLHKTNPELAAHTLVLDKAKHPRPKLCGGGVMRPADLVLRQLRIKLDVPAVPIHNAEFRYQGKRYWRRQKNYFRVVRRHEFDAALVDVARKRGMRLQEEESYERVISFEDNLHVETSRRGYRTRALIAADGANSRVRSQMHLAEKSRVSRLIEILTPADAGSAPEFLDHKAVFDFNGVDQGLQGYIWDFPCLDDGVSAMSRGIFDSRFFPRRPKANLKSLFRAGLKARNAYDPEQQWHGHPARWFDPKATYAKHRILLAGDAAGIDPFFGEGISFALLYGMVAASELNSAFETNDFSFSQYREHILSHNLGKALNMRRRLATLAYLGGPPIMLKVLFQVMGRFWF